MRESDAPSLPGDVCVKCITSRLRVPIPWRTAGRDGRPPSETTCFRERLTIKVCVAAGRNPRLGGCFMAIIDSLTLMPVACFIPAACKDAEEE